MKYTSILIRTVLLALVFALPFSSCGDVLETETNSEWDTSYVWRISSISQGVLDRAYVDMPDMPDFYSSNYLDAATDNALTSSIYSSMYKLGAGEMTSKYQIMNNWNTCYNNFQYINQFLENGLGDQVHYIKNDEVQDNAYKERLKGEAYFLRAYWGYRLLQVFGGKTDDGDALGYPIVTSFQDQEELENANLSRNSYEECAQQIMNDCDTAFAYLPLTYSGSDKIVGVTEKGRGSGLASLAIKTQVALYAASPAFQPDNIVTLNGMGDFTIVDESAYKAKWERAAQVAYTCMQTPGFGSVYGLKATDLADAKSTTPGEFILRAYYNSNKLENHHFPPFYLGTANTVPSQNLVDAYPAKNGFPITDARSEYDPQNPYVNRDNRFELSIYYQNKTYGKSGVPVDVTENGAFGSRYSNNNSRTGYYLAKGLSKTQNMLDVNVNKKSVHYFPLLRKTEVFLAFAEAANEAWGPKGLGPDMSQSAYDIIKLLRYKSGGISSTTYLDEVAANTDSFRKLIHNERRIELAFESSRYWDLRRWLDVLNKPVYGVKVTVSDSYNQELIYDYRKVEDRAYNDIKYYYSPLPYDELLKMSNLKNNKGWN